MMMIKKTALKMRIMPRIIEVAKFAVSDHIKISNNKYKSLQRNV